jgi:DNA-binding MarR family transcriptional regulator
MSDDATRVWRGLRELTLERNDRRREVCRTLDLGFVKVKALLYLAEQPLSMSALASALLVDAPYTSVIVTDLERRGLVTRSPNPDDGRSKLVDATALGRKAARTADAILSEPPPSLRNLNGRDLAALDRITSALLEDRSAR